ncbi:MAG: Mrp/NBP35 family ATP-binding protein [Alphaproteobacteria bacterium GM202ARS2]|nr:Mrp/NBP35 family ATP-binding protein [Alphaproteobacteria bacterium GM202ARS2]
MTQKNKKAQKLQQDIERQLATMKGTDGHPLLTDRDEGRVDVSWSPNRPRVIIDIGTHAPVAYQPLVAQLKKEGIDVVLTSARPPPQQVPQPKGSPPPERPKQTFDKIKLPNVRYRLAVTCAKGGVGKSTTAVNVALAFAARGLKVALLDADIYGPSLPLMMGLSGSLRKSPRGKIEPMYRYGVACMSIGLMLPQREDALIWRGPMVMGALQQMLRDVDWGERDILVIDMPPGTGDAQLTLAQRLDVSGAVIVSTPQDVALLDARKGFYMLKRTGIAVLGMVNNMSLFVCPHCGKETEIFGSDGTHQQAKELGIAVLADMPLSLTLRQSGDSGTPLVVSHPDSSEAQTYSRMADKLLTALEAQEKQKA